MNMRNLHPIEYDDNSHAWGVFRYKDIKNILDDHENFSSDLQKWQYPDHQEIQNKKNLITSDPPLLTNFIIRSLRHLIPVSFLNLNIE
jgi:cytochrome P450